MNILLNKKVINAAKTGKYKDVFIVEDLTPFRGHIFKYVRDWNVKNKKFDVVTTDYGQIVVKDKNDTWYRISSTDDFHGAGIPFDTEEFDELL